MIEAMRAKKVDRDTDYPMHMSDEKGEMSQAHLREVDRLLGDILDACPRLELYLTADHGMNGKRRCYDLNRLLPARGCPISISDLLVLGHRDNTISTSRDR